EGPWQRTALHRGHRRRRGSATHAAGRRGDGRPGDRGARGPGRAVPYPGPMSRLARWTLVLAWLALLALAGGWLARNLEVAGDLRRFMPEPRTGEQKLLLEGLGEGPGSRLLLVALEGADPPRLAEQSAAIRASLAADPRFALVAN